MNDVPQLKRVAKKVPPLTLEGGNERRLDAFPPRVRLPIIQYGINRVKLRISKLGHHPILGSVLI